MSDIQVNQHVQLKPGTSTEYGLPECADGIVQASTVANAADLVQVQFNRITRPMYVRRSDLEPVNLERLAGLIDQLIDLYAGHGNLPLIDECGASINRIELDPQDGRFMIRC